MPLAVDVALVGEAAAVDGGRGWMRLVRLLPATNATRERIRLRVVRLKESEQGPRASVVGQNHVCATLERHGRKQIGSWPVWTYGAARDEFWDPKTAFSKNGDLSDTCCQVRGPRVNFSLFIFF